MLEQLERSSTKIALNSWTYETQGENKVLRADYSIPLQYDTGQHKIVNSVVITRSATFSPDITELRDQYNLGLNQVEIGIQQTLSKGAKGEIAHTYMITITYNSHKCQYEFRVVDNTLTKTLRKVGGRTSHSSIPSTEYNLSDLVSTQLAQQDIQTIIVGIIENELNGQNILGSTYIPPLLNQHTVYPNQIVPVLNQTVFIATPLGPGVLDDKNLIDTYLGPLPEAYRGTGQPKIISRVDALSCYNKQMTVEMGLEGHKSPIAINATLATIQSLISKLEDQVKNGKLFDQNSYVSQCDNPLFNGDECRDGYDISQRSQLIQDSGTLIAVSEATIKDLTIKLVQKITKEGQVTPYLQIVNKEKTDLDTGNMNVDVLTDQVLFSLICQYVNQLANVMQIDKDRIKEQFAQALLINIETIQQVTTILSY